jgi:hypothetical protein
MSDSSLDCRITDDDRSLIGLVFTSFESGRSFKVIDVFRYKDDGFDIDLLEVADQQTGVVSCLDPETVRFALANPPRFSDAVDQWASRQPDTPSRSEAIRRLVELGLKERLRG